MKVRFFTLLLMLILTVNSVLAKEFYTCADSYDMSSKFAKYSTNILGMNFIAKQVAKNIIKKELKAMVKGNIKVKLDSYSVFDLKKGIIKGMELSASDIVSEDVYVSQLNAKTLCDFNYINYTKNPIEYKVPMPLDFTMALSESDLNKSFFNEENDVYKDRLKQINLIMHDVLVTKKISAEIRRNRFYIIMNGYVPLIKIPVKVTVSSDINVKNNQIMLNDTLTRGLSKFVSSDTMNEIINMVNPLEYTLNSFETTRDKIIINNVKIIDNKIQINGIMVLGEQKK